MEKQLFSFENASPEWEHYDIMVFGFCDATSKCVLGDFPAGTFFELVVFDYGEGTLKVYEDSVSEKSTTFSLAFAFPIQEIK